MLAIYNGQQFLKETLENIVTKIADINAIHIQDGRWLNSGFTEMNSTDDTERIISEFNSDYKYDVQIIYEKSEKIFESPSDKRNHQLARIACHFEEPYTVFWFDDDEEIRFTTGLERTWVRDSMKTVSVPVTLATYAYDSNEPMLTPRFIPGGKGYHFHTERAMCLHDQSCNVIMEWTPKMTTMDKSKYHHDPEMIIINKWPKRELATQEKRCEFYKHEMMQLAKNSSCKFQGQPES